MKCLVSTIVIFATLGMAWADITNVTDLINAVNNGSAGDTVLIAPGVFELPYPLRPKDGMTIKGAGMGKTILMPVDSWVPVTTSPPDRELDVSTVNRNAYLINLDSYTTDVTISDMTLKDENPDLQGAVFGHECDGLEIYNCQIENFIWSGIRTFDMDFGMIHDNIFKNAGGKVKWNGGGVFVTYVTDSEFYNNWMYCTNGNNYFGFKGRNAVRCRFHHNTVEVSFSIEFAFHNDAYCEIDHNILWGVISIPRGGGNTIIPDGYSWHIHHNWFHKSYSLEFPRNDVLIEHNLFDFDTNEDKGNLITSHWNNPSKPPIAGPVYFYNNLVKNPGRGIFWASDRYNQIYFYNNEVIANTTITPRTEGLFSFPSGTDFSTIEIKDSIIECVGLSRDLIRESVGYAATIENNTLINISDTGSYANPDTGAPRGLIEPLYFYCGAYDEFLVDGWNTERFAKCRIDDVNYNQTIEFVEFANLMNEWLNSGCIEQNEWCAKADVDRSGNVDMTDMRKLFEIWLDLCEIL